MQEPSLGTEHSNSWFLVEKPFSSGIDSQLLARPHRGCPVKADLQMMLGLEKHFANWLKSYKMSNTGAGVMAQWLRPDILTQIYMYAKHQCTFLKNL